MSCSPEPEGPALARIAPLALAAACLAGPAAEAGELRLTTDGRLKADPVFVGPSGREVVYTVQERPTLLRLMRLDPITRSSEPLHPAEQNRTEFEPAFSPDGRRSAFVQNRGNLSLTLVIRADDGRESDVKPSGGFDGPHCPAFSADGSRLLFAQAGDGRQPIVSVDLAGGDRRVVVDASGQHNWPSPSRDGRRLAFGSTRDGNFEIYAADADGAHPVRLTQHPKMDIRPRFSPDGRRIAFTSNRDGNYEVYVMDADGSGLLRLTDNPERDDYPAWHPDGRRLVVVSERDGRSDLVLIDVPDRPGDAGGR